MLQKKQLQKINVNVSALIISSYKKIQNNLIFPNMAVFKHYSRFNMARFLVEFDNVQQKYRKFFIFFF